VITSSYVGESSTINDISGNPVIGTLYTLTADTAYDSNHRHKITIANA